MPKKGRRESEALRIAHRTTATPQAGEREFNSSPHGRSKGISSSSSIEGGLLGI
jgi:hypothetical protein